MHAFSELLTCHLLRYSLESEPLDGERAIIASQPVQDVIADYSEHLHNLFDSFSLSGDAGDLKPTGTLSFDAFENIMESSNMIDSKLQKKELKRAFFMAQREDENVPDPCTENEPTDGMEMVYAEFTEAVVYMHVSEVKKVKRWRPASLRAERGERRS